MGALRYLIQFSVIWLGQLSENMPFSFIFFSRLVKQLNCLKNL